VPAVVLTNVLPGGRRGGGEIVSQSVIDALVAAGREVRVVGYRRGGDRPTEERGEVPAGVRPIETRAAGPRALAWMARALVTREPYSVAKWRSRGYARAVSEAVRVPPEVLIVDHAGLHFAAPAAVRAPLVFIAHNAEARMYERLADAASNPAGRWVNAREARLIGAVEGALARRARQVWTLTGDDADHFRGLAPDADVRTLAVASGVEAPEAAPPACDVALIGSWSWHANALGLRWFSDEVVPLLPQDVSVDVAGAGGEWLRGRHPNVAVRGVVPDAQRFLSVARVIAVPSVTGGGVQVKTLDAIASGAPVVATPVAVRGLGELPESVAVAEDPAGFAAELVRLAGESRDARARRREEARAWSHARRERFESDVAEWVAEAVEGAPGEAPAAASERSATRPA
jgi:hypothetical protein